MTDRTLCSGDGCPVRARCLRFRLVAYGRQSYWGTPPYDHALGVCAYFEDVVTLAPTEHDVRTRAYHLWLAAGRKGDADAHWARAERELSAAFELRREPL
ncbi:MAG: DUF2934 domain-containing protein [Deltaproteobacteria bacterium]|nr:DUF2934 domain-containing protein [Deltaproteobacteria bacterium]